MALKMALLSGLNLNTVTKDVIQYGLLLGRITMYAAIKSVMYNL